MQLKSLQLFIKVVNTGSFIAAALETHARKILMAHDEVINLFKGEPTAATTLRIGAMERAIMCCCTAANRSSWSRWPNVVKPAGQQMGPRPVGISTFLLKSLL